MITTRLSMLQRRVRTHPPLVMAQCLTSVYSFSVTALAVFLPAGVLQMFLRRMMPVGVLAENECDLHSGFFGGPCCHRC